MNFSLTALVLHLTNADVKTSFANSRPVEFVMAELLMALLSFIAPYEMSFRWCGYTHGVPPWLMKGMGYETSHFAAGAAGPTGDHGVMQVIESNAPGCGLSVADLDVPSKNICCAATLMEKNIARVRTLRGGGGADTLKIALYRNNMGGGNTDGHISSGMTWEDFKAATPNFSGKHDWVEKMWSTAQSYRWGEYALNALVLGALGLFLSEAL